MAKTSSLSFPTMFNVSQNEVGVLEDNVSIVNRSRLLILSNPYSLHYNPDFGVGLPESLFKYNTENEKARIQEKIKHQLDLHEPYVVSEDTQFVDGLLFTGREDAVSQIQDYNKLEFTCALTTTYSEVTELTVDGWGEYLTTNEDEDE